MRVQVAHELCHTWFGIVIGPQDWTEEWLTEGFCTYLEDLLHAQISQVSHSWCHLPTYLEDLLHAQVSQVMSQMVPTYLEDLLHAQVSQVSHSWCLPTLRISCMHRFLR